MSRYEELVTEATKAYRASKQNKKNDLSDYIPSLSDAVSVLIHDRDRYKAKVEALERAIRDIAIFKNGEAPITCLTCKCYDNLKCDREINACTEYSAVFPAWQFDEARFSTDDGGAE